MDQPPQQPPNQYGQQGQQQSSFLPQQLTPLQQLLVSPAAQIPPELVPPVAVAMNWSYLKPEFQVCQMKIQKQICLELYIGLIPTILVQIKECKEFLQL